MTLDTQMTLSEQVEICPVTAENCDKLPCGQQCLYKLTGSEQDVSITGTHTTPVSRWVPA